VLCSGGIAQNLSNVAYACGRLNHLDPSLLATIARRALAQMRVCSTTTCWLHLPNHVMLPPNVTGQLLFDAKLALATPTCLHTSGLECCGFNS